MHVCYYTNDKSQRGKKEWFQFGGIALQFHLDGWLPWPFLQCCCSAILVLSFIALQSTLSAFSQFSVPQAILLDIKCALLNGASCSCGFIAHNRMQCNAGLCLCFWSASRKNVFLLHSIAVIWLQGKCYCKQSMSKRSHVVGGAGGQAGGCFASPQSEVSPSQPTQPPHINIIIAFNHRSLHCRDTSLSSFGWLLINNHGQAGTTCGASTQADLT